MKASLCKPRNILSRFLNKPQPSPFLPEKEPYVFFKVLPPATPEVEEEIRTGGHLRQYLYKVKPLKSLATALDYAVEGGIHFLKDMAPQNIHLVFGEHPESLFLTLFSLPVSPERFRNPRIVPLEISQDDNKSELEYKAVIFCKLKGTPRVHEFFGYPDREPEDNKWVYIYNWLDFFNLKERLDYPASSPQPE